MNFPAKKDDLHDKIHINRIRRLGGTRSQIANQISIGMRATEGLPGGIGEAALGKKCLDTYSHVE